MSDEERFASLEQGARHLSDDVVSLAGDVRSLTRAIDAAYAQQQIVEQVATEAAHKADVATVESETAKDLATRRNARTMSIVKWGALGVGFLLLLVNVVLYSALTELVRSVTARAESSRNVISREGCLTRNRALNAQIRRETQLALLERDRPAFAKVHRDSVDELRKGIINCVSRYPVPDPTSTQGDAR